MRKHFRSAVSGGNTTHVVHRPLDSATNPVHLLRNELSRMTKYVEADRAQLHPPLTEGASTDSSLFFGGTERDSLAIDDTDQLLIGHLLEDGKMTNRELAQITGVSESAISIRLRKLTASRVLVFTALIDWEMAGFEWFAIARIKSRGRPPKEIAQQIAVLPQCEAVAVVLGSHDVVAFFLTKDRAELHHLVNDELPRVEGISDLIIDLATETSVSARGRQFFLAKAVPPIRLPHPRIDLDDLDISIIQALIDDGRQSSRKIARTFHVSEGTVRSRVTRLNSAGLIKVAAMVEPVALGLAGVIACVSLKVQRDKAAEVRSQLMQLPELAFLAVTVGISDISITVTAADNAHLIDLVSSRLQVIDGVQGTETLLMVDVIRFSPYMKRLA